MPGRENGKRRYFIYDLSTALEELRFTRAFGPGILAALFYGVISGSMSFINKVVLTSYTFHFPNVLMLAQVIMLSVILEAGRLLGYSSMPKYTLERELGDGAFPLVMLHLAADGIANCHLFLHRGKKFFIPSVCFALHTTLALQALDYLSIPMYNVLRRLLPLTSLLFACCMLKKKPSFLVVISVMLVVVGCVTAGFGDLEFSSYAYISALGSVVCQSFYLTYIQRSGVEEGLSTVTVLFTNSVNCIPFLFIYTLCNRELFTALAFDGLSMAGFQAAIVFDVSMGCVLSYSLFLCTTMNSALTTSLVGVIKGVLTTIIGFYTFGGVLVTALTILGVVLNTMGGALYSYAKYTENMTKGIQKHFHSHIIKVNPAVEPMEMKKNGMVDHNHKIKNDVMPDVIITMNKNEDVDVDFENRRASVDGSVISSDSNVE